jgi:hypothetical protein
VVEQRNAVAFLTRRPAACFAALLLAAVACNVAGASEPAPCSAAAAFDSAHAIVGQQVGYGVHIERRADDVAIDWIEPPTFPGFHTEWLPDITEAADAGSRSNAYEERRAVFPEHAGMLSSTEARLRCDTGEEIRVVVVPPVSLRVETPPTRNRPDDFEGLIGPLAIERVVTPQPASLGGSIRVAVMLRGEGNLWLADDPLGPIAAADVFRRPAHNSLDTGTHLTLKRHFVYDVVPLRAGELEIPAIQFAYFDTEQGRFGVARAEALTVVVAAAAVADDTVSESISRPAAGEVAGEPVVGRTAPDDATNHSRKPALTIAFAVLVAGAGALLQRYRRRHAARKSTAAELADGPAAAAAISQALRRAIAPHVAGIATRTAEELEANPALPEHVATAVRLLAEAERARFDPNARIPDRAAVLAAIERL